MKNKYFVDLTPELIQKAQERLDYVLNEGCLYPGVSDNFDSNAKPEWYDEERFKKSQQFALEYFSSVHNSSLIGLFLVFQLPIGLVPLLATGQSKNTPKLFNRYLNTIQHVHTWENNDPFDPESKAFKSQNLVKKMHKNVGKLMNSKISVYDFVKKTLNDQEAQNNEKNNNENNNENNYDNNNLKNKKFDVDTFVKNKDRVWVSQTDMALTQWAFIGVLILEPYYCGVHGATKETIEEIIYMWKVISYRIGIEDRFNIFRDVEYDFVYALCKLILEQCYLPYLENVSSPLGIKMSQSTLKGLSSLIPNLRWKTFLKYWYEKLNINCYKFKNTELYDSEKYDFPIFEKKNIMSEEEKKLQLEKGYNGKYIVPNPNIPFEKLELKGFSEKFFYNLFLFDMNCILKSSFLRNLIRKINKKRLNNNQKNKTKITKKLIKKYGDDVEFPACPFACSVDNDYLDFDEIKK